MSTHYLLDYAGGRLEVGTLGKYRKRTLAVIAGNMVEDLAGREKWAQPGPPSIDFKDLQNCCFDE